MEVTAYRAIDECAGRLDDDVARFAQMCMEMVSERVEQDVLLTLNHGGVFDVRWVGGNDEYEDVADEVAAYYVRPVLELSEGFGIPAGRDVYVTVSMGTYGSLQPGVTATLTLTVTAPPDSGFVPVLTMTEIAYPGEMARITLTEVSLADGEALTVSLLDESFGTNYTPGRNRITLRADADVDAGRYDIKAAMSHCGQMYHNINTSPCRDESTEAGWSVVLDIQHWLESPQVSVSMIWRSAETGSTPTTPPMVTAVLSSTQNAISVAVPTDADGEFRSGYTLEVHMAVDGTPMWMGTAYFPVVTVELSKQRHLFAAAQLAQFGSYSSESNRYNLVNTLGVGVPSSILDGPPGYVQGAPIYDFSIYLPQGVPYASVLLQHPEGLSNALPGNLFYWKYRDLVGWSPFIAGADENGYGNAVYSAPSFPCPVPRTDTPEFGWTPGLARGHQCVLLVISDDGPNDDDELRNGIIVDPGAVGGRVVPPDEGGGNLYIIGVDDGKGRHDVLSGRGMLSWLEVLFITLLVFPAVLSGWRRRRRRCGGDAGMYGT